MKSLKCHETHWFFSASGFRFIMGFFLFILELQTGELGGKNLLLSLSLSCVPVRQIYSEGTIYSTQLSTCVSTKVASLLTPNIDYLLSECFEELQICNWKSLSNCIEQYLASDAHTTVLLHVSYNMDHRQISFSVQAGVCVCVQGWRARQGAPIWLRRCCGVTASARWCHWQRASLMLTMELFIIHLRYLSAGVRGANKDLMHVYLIWWLWCAVHEFKWSMNYFHNMPGRTCCISAIEIWRLTTDPIRAVW